MANLIVLIFKNGENVPNDYNFWGVFFHFLKNKFTKLVNFITKSSHSLSTFFFSFCLVSFWLESELAINERAFTALKRVLSNKVLHTLNEWAQYPSSFWEGYGLI